MTFEGLRYFIDESLGVLIMCPSASVGGRHRPSICSVSISEKGKERVMKEEVDENGERQQEKKRKDQR